MALSHLQNFFMLLMSGNATFYSGHSSLPILLIMMLESVGEQTFHPARIAGSQLKVFVSRTNKPGRFVATQVADSHFTAHKLARGGYFHPLSHSFVCLWFLLIFLSSWIFSRGNILNFS